MVSVWDVRGIIGAVTDADSYQRWHQRAIAASRAKGRDITYHEETAPVLARIDHNRLLVDCVCGAGNAVERTRAEARCGDCGAHHTHVIVHPLLPQVIRLLEQRPRLDTRNWFPSESLDDLMRENAQHAIRAER